MRHARGEHDLTCAEGALTPPASTGYRSAPMSLRRLLLLSLLLTSVSTPAAQAADDQQSIMMDDDQLLYRSESTRGRTLTTMRSLGADAIRVSVLWRVVAENADLTNADIDKLDGEAKKKRARKQRMRFKPSDPRTYPTRNWDRYDNVVKEATSLGMRVYFTLTGPGPRYGHKIAPPSQRANAGTYKPYPSRFRSFVEAVGKRYSGSYKDENAIRGLLPRVALWSIWNEPNQPGWLTPQWEKRGGETVPASPGLYRRLFVAGRQGLERSGHGDDVILLGETSPLGSPLRGPRNGIRPVPFLRELACIAPNGQQYVGVAAQRRDCVYYAVSGPLKATGYAHHPYTKKGVPTVAPKVPDEVTIANIASLGPLLDTISDQSGGKIPRDLPILLTEFGYESNPPDPRNGVSLMRQAQFNQLAEFLAYQDPRVKAMTQFLVRDAAPLKRFAKGSRFYWFTYQSGLYNLKGQAKPAAYGYTFPLVLFPAGEGVIGFWGQMRFRPNGSDDTVVFMWRPDTKTDWAPLGAPVKTNFRGFFSGSVPIPGPGGQYRAGFLDAETGAVKVSSLFTAP